MTEMTAQERREEAHREPWQIGPFTKHGTVNPVLGPEAETIFDCPLAGPVFWEKKDVFNPAAATRHGAVHLLYRAEDPVGPFLGTSRIGLAVSRDGLTFERRPQPVLFPDRDVMQTWKWPGGFIGVLGADATKHRFAGFRKTIRFQCRAFQVCHCRAVLHGVCTQYPNKILAVCFSTWVLRPNHSCNNAALNRRIR